MGSAALLLGACGEQSGSLTDAGGKHPVIAVGSQWYGHIPVRVGMERGIFSRRGFEVRWRAIGKSMDRLNAISSGEAQFVSLGEIAMLSSRPCTTTICRARAAWRL